jgi:uncharacterized protein DUF6221
VPSPVAVVNLDEMPLAEFLAARLDEDEAVAKAVRDGSAPWEGQWQLRDRLALETRNGWVIAVSPGLHMNLDLAAREFAPGVVEHIARHDPARVLREVEAKRAILARYEDCLIRMEDPEYPNAVARDQAREYEDFVLPDLASAWAGHPDYDEAWAP